MVKVPRLVKTPVPILLLEPPPVLYFTYKTEFIDGISPRAVVLIKLAELLINDSRLLPSFPVPLPKVNLQKPESVYSLTNLLVVFCHLAGVMDELSDVLLLSSTKTLSSAKESTSYHLIFLSLKKLSEGIPPTGFSVVIILSTESTFVSGNVSWKNGL